MPIALAADRGRLSSPCLCNGLLQCGYLCVVLNGL